MLQLRCHHSKAIPEVTCSFCHLSTPQTLLDICFNYISTNLESICEVDPITKNFKLKEGLTVPVELCERLLHLQVLNVDGTASQFINIFKDRGSTRLKRVRLKESSLTDRDLEILMQNYLHEIDLSDCTKLTSSCVKLLTEYGTKLSSLSIGGKTDIFPQNVYGLLKFSEGHYDRSFIFIAPSLRKLSVRSAEMLQEDFYMLLLSPLPLLTHLDLSNSGHLGNLEYASHLVNLSSLVLYNVEDMESKIPTVCQLRNLRHLDISQSKEDQGKYENPNQVLKKIVKNLPYLNSLDISGTNLAGRGVAEMEMTACPSDIPGLACRASNPFHFLGLYETSHDACLRHDIPAKLIAGNANEEQVLIAALAYLDRPELLQRVLNELFHLFRFESCEYVGQALNIVLKAMSRHVHERHIQISGSATLFYIVKGTGSEELNGSIRVKKKIISTLLNGMAMHKNDDTMMRNGCLTLCQFKIPGDVLFEYDRLVDILLHSVNGRQQESFVQRIGIYLLNSLACQVDGRQKIKLGELGAISKMIWLISYRLEQGLCDDVLEVAWSTMWNVTDETPLNCQKFLEKNGMEYFLSCLQKFPHKEELLRNMMGLLGNVAEVRELRHYLITTEYLSVFSDLLDSTSDGIEVSYNAAGVISHIASDGPEVWSVNSPSRKFVLEKMVVAIERWDINSPRNINYRSFEPILYLVKIYHTPECQRWAVWALANLTQVYPDKYCVLVEKEGGLDLLEELFSYPHPTVPAAVKQLAVTVLENCRKYKLELSKSEGQLEG